jgi:DNA-binding CsgD family transcriptional regulator
MNDPLTPRELQMLKLISTGLNQPQVAAAMGIGLETVKTYTAMVRLKLQADNTTHAVAIALRKGVLQ